MNVQGTCYFVSMYHAVKYYRVYCDDDLKYTRKYATMLINEGSIHIGKPELKPNESLCLLDNGSRYGIVTKE